MSVTTVSGSGGVISSLQLVSFGTGQSTAIDNAITALTNNALTDYILTAETDVPPVSSNSFYNFSPTSNDGFVEKSGAVGVVLYGSVAESLTTNGTANLIVGNNGSDTVNTSAGADTIVFASIGNVVSQTGGADQIYSQDGHDTINLSGGAATIENGGLHEVVNISGSSTLNTATSTVGVPMLVNILGGTDSITLHYGASTVSQTGGAATIVGGAGTLSFTQSTVAGSGTAVITLGAGAGTLTGGGGNDSFTGGSGTASMTGGSGANVFTAGNGADTMNGSTVAGSTNQFNFSTADTGSYKVNNFLSSDSIHIAGFTSAQVIAASSFSGGNTTITLSAGHTITLVGFDLLTGGTVD